MAELAKVAIVTGSTQGLGEAIARQLIAEQVQTPQADEEACRRYYQSNRKRFRSVDLYEARHILFAAAPNDARARAESRQQAKQIIDELKRDTSRFAQLAEAMSGCPSAKVGGNLGQIGPGQTAAALTVAELTGTTDMWTNYVEVFPSSRIVCNYVLPAGSAVGGSSWSPGPSPMPNCASAASTRPMR